MTKFEQLLGYKLEPNHKAFQKQVRKLSNKKLMLKALTHILIGTGLSKDQTVKIIIAEEMFKRSECYANQKQ